MVVRGVEADLDLVAWRRAAAPAEAVPDERRIAHQHLDSDVQIAVVVRHADGHLLCRGRHVVGIFLDEVGNRLRAIPHLVVHATVDAYGRRSRPNTKCVELFPDLVLRSRLARARGLLAFARVACCETLVARGSPFSEASPGRQRNPYEGRGGPAASGPHWSGLLDADQEESADADSGSSKCEVQSSK